MAPLRVATIYHEKEFLIKKVYIRYSNLAIPVLTIRPDRIYYGGS